MASVAISDRIGKLGRSWSGRNAISPTTSPATTPITMPAAPTISASVPDVGVFDEILRGPPGAVAGRREGEAVGEVEHADARPGERDADAEQAVHGGQRQRGGDDEPVHRPTARSRRRRVGGLLGVADEQRVADVLLQLAGVHAEHAVDAALDQAEVLLGDDHRAVADVDLARAPRRRCAEMIGASPSDGSSTRNTRGSPMNARPSETIRRSPPDSVPTDWSSSFASGGKISRIRGRGACGARARPRR